ncbi:Rrf2 family transcriptional regulator [Clostridium malenominatum]|uniref:Rrf2 family transcriptional regulator n=1 Tax=Clostridium malenominatum TaxID=1539 RepID=A0ABN1IXF3_9CLOT
MKISTKGRYGLKAMMDIAIYTSYDNITLKSISERQNISEKYLEQIFSALRKNGLVISKKGSQGGYALAKESSKILVGDILRVLEGDLDVVDWEDTMKNDFLEKCIYDNVWKELNISIEKIVNSITLEDLVGEYNKSSGIEYMYYI